MECSNPLAVASSMAVLNGTYMKHDECQETGIMQQKWVALWYGVKAAVISAAFQSMNWP